MGATVDDVARAKSDSAAAWRRAVQVWCMPFAREATRARAAQDYEESVRVVGERLHSRAVHVHAAHAARVPAGGRHYAVRADAYRTALTETGTDFGGERLLVHGLSNVELEDYRRDDLDEAMKHYQGLLYGLTASELTRRYPLDDLRAHQEVRAVASLMPSVWTRLSNTDAQTPLHVRATITRPGTSRPRGGSLLRAAVTGPGLSDRGAGLPPSRHARMPSDVSTPRRRRGERWWRDPHPVAVHDELAHDGVAWRVLARGAPTLRRSTIAINGWFGDESRARVARPSDLVWRMSAAHEFAHRVERLDPRIFLATHAFLDRRSGAELKVIDASTGTLGRDGDFITPYTGRDSGRAATTEVFTTGIEALWFGRHGGFEGVRAGERIAPRDEEHRDLILGLFATATYDRSTRLMRKARIPRWS